MSTLALLAIILCFLMVYVGRKQGIKAFSGLFVNILLLGLFVILIILKINIILLAILFCIIMALFNIFVMNGYTRVSIITIIATSITFILSLIIVYGAVIFSGIQGFAMEEGDEIATYHLNIGINFVHLSLFIILVSTLGAIIDLTISVSSSMEEIYINQPTISNKQLFKSGMNVARDILGTTINTLFFAYLGSYLTLLIWFSKLNYSFGDIINSKVLSSELMTLLCAGIAVTLAIPVTSFTTLNILKRLHFDHSHIHHNKKRNS
ncbi:YibE/F family protein [Macrococcus capreoli]|uniref:YibE/F family protein n=1 Tax=Macrococcus capreoli TaxID=2982690 RepID=UPI0021D60203|nr:YibE/F family protein [Macrococcus sp. TMW 2.2395]MCU7558276.1 YibE/F family protein [Macrococcus sp. TMW 2.2395]